MASFIDKKLECVLIADGITKNSCKLMARDFIHCDDLEDVLVSFVTAVAQESFIANGFKDASMTNVLCIHGWYNTARHGAKYCWQILTRCFIHTWIVQHIKTWSKILLANVNTPNLGDLYPHKLWKSPFATA